MEDDTVSSPSMASLPSLPSLPKLPTEEADDLTQLPEITYPPQIAIQSIADKLPTVSTNDLPGLGDPVSTSTPSSTPSYSIYPPLPDLAPTATDTSQSKMQIPDFSTGGQQSKVTDKAPFTEPTGHVENSNGHAITLPDSWSKADVDKSVKIASKYGMTPNEFMGIVTHETAGTMSPSIVNPIGATGLIQFTPTTSASMLLESKRHEAFDRADKEIADKGLTGEAAAKVRQDAADANPLYWQLSPKDQGNSKVWAQKAVKNMDVDTQLNLVDKYLEKSMQGTKGLDNAYSAIFAGSPNAQSIPSGTRAYEANKALDKDHKGVITRDDWLNPVRQKAGKISEVHSAHGGVVGTDTTGEAATPTDLSDFNADLAHNARLAYPTNSEEDQAARARVMATPKVWAGKNGVELDTETDTGQPSAGVYRTPNFTFEGKENIPQDPGAYIAIKPGMSRENTRASLIHEAVGHAGSLKQDDYTTKIKPGKTPIEDQVDSDYRNSVNKAYNPIEQQILSTEGINFPKPSDFSDAGKMGTLLNGADINRASAAGTRFKTTAKAADMGGKALDAEQQKELENKYSPVELEAMWVLGLLPPTPSSAYNFRTMAENNPVPPDVSSAPVTSK